MIAVVIYDLDDQADAERLAAAETAEVVAETLRDVDRKLRDQHHYEKPVPGQGLFADTFNDGVAYARETLLGALDEAGVSLWVGVSDGDSRTHL